jgi:hypothetical protein
MYTTMYIHKMEARQRSFVALYQMKVYINLLTLVATIIYATWFALVTI